MTIPKEVLNKIDRKYPEVSIRHFERKSAAEFGYTLAERRIKELELQVFTATVCCGVAEGENLLLKTENEKLEGRIKELEELYKEANIQHKHLSEAYIEATDKLDKWISVKDGLPEVLECVLWRLEDGKMIVDALSKDKSWPYWYAKPTHYQYLPKPPKSI